MDNFETIELLLLNTKTDYVKTKEKGLRAPGVRVRRAMQQIKQVAHSIRKEMCESYGHCEKLDGPFENTGQQSLFKFPPSDSLTFALLQIETDTNHKGGAGCSVQIIAMGPSREKLEEQARLLCSKKYDELNCSHTYIQMNNDVTIGANYGDGKGCIAYKVIQTQ